MTKQYPVPPVFYGMRQMVQFYPLLRDISRVTGSVPNGQAAFVDSNGNPQNIDHDGGGFLPHDDWLSRFPLEGLWGHWTYDYVQLVDINGQDPSSHHNGGFPDQDQSQSSVLFQHQQQPPGQAWSQEQRPASHNPELGFTAQAFEDGFNEERNEPFALTAQTDELHEENLNLEAVCQKRRPKLSMRRRRSRAQSLPYRPVPEATKSSASHEGSSHAAPENDGSVGSHLSAFRVIRGGEASAALLRLRAEMVSHSYARGTGLPTPSQIRDRSRGPEPGSTASDTSEV
ncbi:hypothetical protein MTO96_000705 [Rhipicephalus appendiculatus]